MLLCTVTCRTGLSPLVQQTISCKFVQMQSMMFAQWLNLLTTHISENILVIKYYTGTEEKMLWRQGRERLRMLASKIGEVWPQAKECQQPTSAGRGRSGFSPEPPEGAADIFMFAWCQTSDLQNCERRNVCYFKPLSFWFVMAARPYFYGWPEFSGFWHFFTSK